MYTTPSSPQRTPEQLIALRRSFSRIAGGSPAFPSHSRFTGGSPVRRSRIAGGSPAVSVSRIAGGSPAIPSIVPDPDPPPFLTPTLNRSRPQPSTVLDPDPPPFPTPNRSLSGAILWTCKKFNFRWWESEFKRECLSSFVSWIYTLLDLNSFWIYMIWIHMPYQLWGRDVKFVLAYN